MNMTLEQKIVNAWRTYTTAPRKKAEAMAEGGFAEWFYAHNKAATSKRYPTPSNLLAYAVEQGFEPPRARKSKRFSPDTEVVLFDRRLAYELINGPATEENIVKAFGVLAHCGLSNVHMAQTSWEVGVALYPEMKSAMGLNVQYNDKRSLSMANDVMAVWNDRNGEYKQRMAAIKALRMRKERTAEQEEKLEWLEFVNEVDPFTPHAALVLSAMQLGASFINAMDVFGRYTNDTALRVSVFSVPAAYFYETKDEDGNTVTKQATKRVAKLREDVAAAYVETKDFFGSTEQLLERPLTVSSSWSSKAKRSVQDTMRTSTGESARLFKDSLAVLQGQQVELDEDVTRALLSEDVATEVPVSAALQGALPADPNNTRWYRPYSLDSRGRAYVDTLFNEQKGFAGHAIVPSAIVQAGRSPVAVDCTSSAFQVAASVFTADEKTAEKVNLGPQTQKNDLYAGLCAALGEAMMADEAVREVFGERYAALSQKEQRSVVKGALIPYNYDPKNHWFGTSLVQHFETEVTGDVSKALKNIWKNTLSELYPSIGNTIRWIHRAVRIIVEATPDDQPVWLTVGADHRFTSERVREGFYYRKQPVDVGGVIGASAGNVWWRSSRRDKEKLALSMAAGVTQAMDAHLMHNTVVSFDRAARLAGLCPGILVNHDCFVVAGGGEEQSLVTQCYATAMANAMRDIPVLERLFAEAVDARQGNDVDGVLSRLAKAMPKKGALVANAVQQSNFCLVEEVMELPESVEAVFMAA